MDLPSICEHIKKRSEAGFVFETFEQVAWKVVEELAEVRQALSQGDQVHLEEEVGDLIQATLAMADFLGVRGDQALEKAFLKLQRRYQRYEELIKQSNKDQKAMSFEDRLAVWHIAKTIS